MIIPTDEIAKALARFHAPQTFRCEGLAPENINQIVEREKLMKEIWEEKGVVVISRNVDVLVSKLRKKLSYDNSIKFINEPGRGYKLIIE
jgi:DNA-binding response OmpR family regulator